MTEQPRRRAQDWIQQLLGAFVLPALFSAGTWLITTSIDGRRDDAKQGQQLSDIGETRQALRGDRSREIDELIEAQHREIDSMERRILLLEARCKQP